MAKFIYWSAFLYGSCCVVSYVALAPRCPAVATGLLLVYALPLILVAFIPTRARAV